MLTIRDLPAVIERSIPMPPHATIVQGAAVERLRALTEAQVREVIEAERAVALREAADAFEGGAINVEVFGDGPEVVYWRAANETRGSIVSSLRARADRIERKESA